MACSISTAWLLHEATSCPPILRNVELRRSDRGLKVPTCRDNLTLNFFNPAEELRREIVDVDAEIAAWPSVDEPVHRFEEDDSESQVGES